MMTSAAIRQQFMDFFRSKGHTIVPSAPIVIKNDPTLLFTNAGMNQFKEYFLGNKKPPYPRVADTQKCLRVSGKHNDLEEVGVDTYHHTMFEMLGNWSFGDYFKKDAIAWSWELLTKVYGLDKERLYVTIFEGDAAEHLDKDEEALAEWKKWIPEERILSGNKKDNFWEMGETGPCGPCSEIHVDCRNEEDRKLINGKTLVNNDHPQVIEIWNNVFMQFNRLKDGSLEPLPAKHVDTGMGFERLVRVLQNKQSNYDTDIFTGTIIAIEKITGKKYEHTGNRRDIAFRVLSDHIRAIAFTIADGQLPSNTGAGYVIRRILRRAVRYSYSYLDYKEPILFLLMPLLAEQFVDVFPELLQQLDFIRRVVKEEEESFLRTLEKGLARFETYQQDQSSQNSDKIIEGSFAFELNDTFGFPIDLTRLMAREIGWDVDMQGFEMALQQQKSRSRAATAIDAEDWIVLIENPVTEFVGYELLETKSKIVKYRKVTSKGKDRFQLVLNVTPFYAESGGQVGDTGVLTCNGTEIKILDTKKENDLIIHVTESVPSLLSGEWIAHIDGARRKSIAVHHSATHLLHAALRQVLGTHVAQKGSLVNEEHLRFDFSHFTAVTPEELKKIVTIINERIRENIPVVISEMHKDEAMKLGAMALFGEKYGDIVRVVIIDPHYSVELCGGTHVGRTGDLGLFVIIQENAVASGVRRIEAKAGKSAFNHLEDEYIAPLEEIRKLTKRKTKELPAAFNDLASENSNLKKRIEHLEARQLVGIRNELLQKDEIINQINFIGGIVEVSHADALKKLCLDLKSHLRDFVVVLCANIGGKPHIALCIADNVVAAKTLDAGKIIKEHLAPIIEGNGGGQKNLAIAGGKHAGALQSVIDTMKSLLATDTAVPLLDDEKPDQALGMKRKGGQKSAEPGKTGSSENETQE